MIASRKRLQATAALTGLEVSAVTSCCAVVLFGLSRGKRGITSLHPYIRHSAVWPCKPAPLFLMAGMVVLWGKPMGSERSVAPQGLFFVALMGNHHHEPIYWLYRLLSAKLPRVVSEVMADWGVSVGLGPSDGALMNSTTVSVYPYCYRKMYTAAAAAASVAEATCSAYKLDCGTSLDLLRLNVWQAGSALCYLATA